jgi:DNA-binding response OmpR family regulator
LVTHRNSVVTYRLAERLLWGENVNASELVKKYIMRVRRKLGDDPQNPRWIINVHGVGYRFIGASSPSGGADPGGRSTEGEVAG